MLAARLSAGRVFADDRAGQQNIAHQAAVLRRIADIHTARQHGNRQAAGPQRAPVCRAVVAQRHTADRNKSGFSQRAADMLRGLQTVRRGLARADNGNAGRDVKIRPFAAHIQNDWRIFNRAQAIRIGTIAQRNDLDAVFGALRHNMLCFVCAFIAQRIHLYLAQRTLSCCGQCRPVGGKYRLRRAERAQQARCRSRAHSAPGGKPNITQP